MQCATWGIAGLIGGAIGGILLYQYGVTQAWWPAIVLGRRTAARITRSPMIRPVRRVARTPTTQNFSFVD